MTAGRGRVAVTGGTGFLGPYLIAALTAAGWRVRLLSRRVASQGNGEVEVVQGGLDDAVALDRLMDGADALVHAAGAIKARTRTEFFLVNRDGSRLVAEAARRHGVERAVMVSSLAAREPGLSDYAASKRAGEEAFRAVLPQAAVVRPCAVYGPGDRETAPWFRAAAKGPLLPVPKVPGGRVCLIHAADVADAVSALCGVPDRAMVASRPFELSDPRADGYGWMELAAAMRRAAGTRTPIIQIPPSVFRIAALGAMFWSRVTGRAVMLSPGKVRELFHPDWSSAGHLQPPPDLWRPRVTLVQGFAQTFQWLGLARAA